MYVYDEAALRLTAEQVVAQWSAHNTSRHTLRVSHQPGRRRAVGSAMVMVAGICGWHDNTPNFQPRMW